MSLSNELISEFAKLTKNEKQTSVETTVNGTIVEYNGDKYVRLDGSDLLTPIQTTSSIKNDDRVVVLIKNHTATVMGNMTSPSIGDANIKDIVDQITEVEILVADKVSTEDFDAEVGRIEYLIADNVTIKETITANSALIVDLTADNVIVKEQLKANEASIKSLNANKLNVTTAKATYATITDLEATDATIYNLESTYAAFEIATTNRLSAIDARIDNLDVGYATIADLDVERARIDVLEAGMMGVDSAYIKELQADIANINTLIFGSATGDVIQSSFSNAIIAQLGNAQIKSAMIESVSADKITAGDIITNNVKVRSDDGKLIISDETIQISDNSRVRVQVGKDSSNDYSINIWDADGNLMFSEGGITDSAIKDAIIRNDMVSDTANISAHKLNIDSLFEEINGSNKTIKSSKIYLDSEGQTLDVAFVDMGTYIGTINNKVTSQGTSISVMQGQIANKIWQQDIDDVSEELNTKYSSLEQNVDGIYTMVSTHDVDIGGLTKRVAIAEASIETQSSEIAMKVSKTEFKAMSEQLDIFGRNFIIRRDELYDTYVVASGEILDCETSYNSATMLEPIRVVAGETYTFSKNESSSGYYFRWAWYDENMTVLGRNANDGNNFQWIAPDNAAYVIVSYPYVNNANVKMEKGDTATKYSPAIEDMNDAVDEKLSNYPTTVEMNSAITLSKESVISSVSKTYTTKTELENLKIGGRNLIKNSDFSKGLNKWVSVGVTTTVEEDDVHGVCIKIVSTDIGSSNSRIYPSTTDNFTHVLGKYTVSFYAKADTVTTMQTNVAGGNAGICNYSLSTSWAKFTHSYDASAGSITFWPNEANTTIYLAKIKLEYGDKATDWTPAPEDMATADDLAEVQSSTALVETRVNAAESVIQQLSDSISTLVTDGNGESLMVQTENGWTFSTGYIESVMNTASENLIGLMDEMGDTKLAVNALEQAVTDLGVLNDYVKIGTYENEPCIELGESDSDFKLLITNTRIMFMEGSGVPAYLNNQSLFIKKAVIEEELQQGQFVWKARANGNLGLIWKGAAN